MRSNRWITYGGRRLILADWAKETGISTATLRGRLKSGWPLDKVFGVPAGGFTKRGRLLTFNGRTQSLSAWAGEIKIAAGTLHRRLEAGWTEEEALSNATRTAQLITFQGKTRSLSDWAHAYSLSLTVLWKRLRRGWPMSSALTSPMGSRPAALLLAFRGKKQTVAAWSTELKLDDGTLRSRLSRGWSVSKALTTPTTC